MSKLRKVFLSPAYLVLLVLLSVLLYLLSYMPRVLSGRYYHFLSRFWCRIMLRVLDVDLRLVMNSSTPVPDHYIMVANHPSALEDFAVPALFDIYPLAKVEVKDWFVLGRISDYAGTIYVERESKDSRKRALKCLIDAVSAGRNLVIFPEGGCKGKRIHERFMAGAFDIAMRTGVPILPVYLCYHDEDAFEWTDQTLVQKLWQIYLNEDNLVEYQVHEPLDPADFHDSIEFAEHTRQLFIKWEQQRLSPAD
jgi:1-acyl-sn-glycerol-3-phosphate acyltransferase